MSSSDDIVDTKRVEINFPNHHHSSNIKNTVIDDVYFWCANQAADDQNSSKRYQYLSKSRILKIIFGKIVIVKKKSSKKKKVLIWDEEIYNRIWSLMKSEREKKKVQVSMYNHHKKDRRRIINCMNPLLFVEMTRFFSS